MCRSHFLYRLKIDHLFYYHVKIVIRDFEDFVVKIIQNPKVQDRINIRQIRGRFEFIKRKDNVNLSLFIINI